MRIQMTETRRGAADGVTVVEYVKGESYELPDTPRGRELGDLFVREGWAQELDAELAPTPAPPKPEPVAVAAAAVLDLAAEAAPAPPSPPPAAAAPKAKHQRGR